MGGGAKYEVRGPAPYNPSTRNVTVAQCFFSFKVWNKNGMNKKDHWIKAYITQNIISHILSNFPLQMTWNQNFLSSKSWDIFASKIPKILCKMYDVNVLFYINLNKELRDIISGESWSSQTEFWKVDLPQNFGKLPGKRLWQSSHSNVQDTSYNFTTKRPPKKWFSEWLFWRISEVHLKVCQISMMEPFCESCQKFVCCSCFRTFRAKLMVLFFLLLLFFFFEEVQDRPSTITYPASYTLVISWLRVLK